MEIKEHQKGDIRIAEVVTNETLIHSAEDALDLLGNIYYQGYHAMILEEKQITKDFFELKNGMAGEILQKFSNYRMKLAIVSDFDKYQRKSVRDFIYESNQTGRIVFVASLGEAIEIL